MEIKYLFVCILISVASCKNASNELVNQEISNSKTIICTESQIEGGKEISSFIVSKEEFDSNYRIINSRRFYKGSLSDFHVYNYVSDSIKVKFTNFPFIMGEEKVSSEGITTEYSLVYIAEGNRIHGFGIFEKKDTVQEINVTFDSFQNVLSMTNILYSERDTIIGVNTFDKNGEIIWNSSTETHYENTYDGANRILKKLEKDGNIFQYHLYSFKGDTVTDKIYVKGGSLVEKKISIKNKRKDYVFLKEKFMLKESFYTDGELVRERVYREK